MYDTQNNNLRLQQHSLRLQQHGQCENLDNIATYYTKQ